MIRRTLLAFVVLMSPFSPAVASDDPAAPSSNVLFQLEKQNRSRPWLRIATDSTRLELRVRGLDRRGLHGFTAREGVLPPGEPISWSRIGRIDEVVTRAPAGRMIGAIVLGLAGAGLGNALGAPDDAGGRYALIGLAAFGSLGRWAGGRFGERFQHERNWYVADPEARRARLASPVIATPPESVRAGNTPPAAETTTTAAAPSRGTSDDAIRIAKRIGRDDVFRVESDSGRFQGFATVAGPEGLEGLRVDRKARREWAGARVPERISWEAIDEVQMRGGRAGSGALGGALIFGAIGALLGTAAIAVADPSGATIGEGALLGAGILAPFGLVLGGGVGALSRRWVVVYRRP